MGREQTEIKAGAGNPAIAPLPGQQKRARATRKEKAKAATNTPLPKAIIVAIIDFGKLTNESTNEPRRRGILATNP